MLSQMGARTKIRADIQALRGIAVGLVVLDHFKIGPFHQGFLGVDIFFVISGFLITRIVTSEIDAGKFSFAEFYSRRAKRLLPAVYVTIILTSVASIWFLDSVEMASLTAQTWGAITYTINFVLWSQVGYFDVAAGLKPLLHLWSLAVEEQFYIIFPAFLVLVPKRHRHRAIALAAALSFIACLCVVSFSPTTAFYLLPTRAWELMLGAFGALIATRPRWTSVAYWPALGVLVAVPIVGTGMPHPGIDAALVCLATLVIILAERGKIVETYPSRMTLQKLGDISYSLYLVHWPVVAFLNNAFGMEPPIAIRASGLVVSIALATGLHLAVEEPGRRLSLRRLRLASTAMLIGLMAAAVQIAAQAYARGRVDLAHLKRPNYGLDIACDNYIFENRNECRTSAAPTALIWGDSYAMAVASGARYHLPDGLVQATYSACPPFIGYAPYAPARDDADLVSKYCIAFNDGVEKFVLQERSIRTVIIAASFWQYTVPGFKMMRRDGAGTARVEASDLDTTERILVDEIHRLRLAGKHVVVVAPPPGVDEENLVCNERLATKRVASYANQCEQSAELYFAGSVGVGRLMDSASKAGAAVVRLSDVTCNETVCHTLIDGVILYRDSGHLSYDGAKKVFDILSEAGRLPPPFR
ncbi:acyltransferase family protein [uncultured Hyphomicrobium sp.]|uniref:acyltransferase family protein n=1 Tax=uncultured Hyphomicrobium sp. TaxID=194373 RepID=UPI00342B5775